MYFDNAETKLAKTVQKIRNPRRPTEIHMYKLPKLRTPAILVAALSSLIQLFSGYDHILILHSLKADEEQLL